MEANQFIFHIFHKTLQQPTGGKSDVVSIFLSAKIGFVLKEGSKVDSVSFL